MERNEDSYEHVFEDVAFLEMQETIHRILAALKPREADVIRLRFGLGGDGADHPRGDDYTLTDLGAMFGVTSSRILQIESKALRKIRHSSRNKRLLAYEQDDS